MPGDRRRPASPHRGPADWHADLGPDDGTVEVTIGVTCMFETDGPIDGSDAFLTAFWGEYVRRADDEVGRLMHRHAGRDFRVRLQEVLEPARVPLERALASQIRAMADELGLAHERLRRAVTRQESRSTEPLCVRPGAATPGRATGALPDSDASATP